MRIGVNVTSPTNFPIAVALVRAGHAQFLDLLVDNFLHVPGGALRAALDELAAQLRALIRAVEPLYVSDHLARFTHGGRRLPMLAERDAERDYVADTGCGVLFDFCNAVVAELNTGYPAQRWLPVVRDMPHFHIAGYRRTEGEPALIIDSHDSPSAEDTLAFLRAFARERGGLAGLTLVVERDANIDFAPWAADKAVLDA